MASVPRVRSRWSSPPPGEAVTPKRPVGSPSSPSAEDTCSICLGAVADKCMAGSCFHTFCLVCLKEWSKQKAVCPLCKTPFTKIIYNIHSETDFKEWCVPRPAPPDPQLIRYSMIFDVFQQRPFMNGTFGYRTTTGFPGAAMLRRLFPGRTLDHPRDAIPSGPREPHHRFGYHNMARSRLSIYEDNVWVQPLADITGLYRETSPGRYREQPALTHRLIPWVNRELAAIVPPSRIGVVLNEVIELIESVPINSRAFRQAMQPHMGLRTEHFVHEFYHFARSPYDMVGHDNAAVYSRRPVVVESSSSDSDDVIEVNDQAGIVSMVAREETLANDGTVVITSDSSDSDSADRAVQHLRRNAKLTGLNRNVTTAGHASSNLTATTSLSSSSNRPSISIERNNSGTDTMIDIFEIERNPDMSVLLAEREREIRERIIHRARNVMHSVISQPSGQTNSGRHEGPSCSAGPAIDNGVLNGHESSDDDCILLEEVQPSWKISPLLVCLSSDSEREERHTSLNRRQECMIESEQKNKRISRAAKDNVGRIGDFQQNKRLEYDHNYFDGGKHPRRKNEQQTSRKERRNDLFSESCDGSSMECLSKFCQVKHGTQIPSDPRSSHEETNFSSSKFHSEHEYPRETSRCSTRLKRETYDAFHNRLCAKGEGSSGSSRVSKRTRFHHNVAGERSHGGSSRQYFHPSDCVTGSGCCVLSSNLPQHNRSNFERIDNSKKSCKTDECSSSSSMSYKKSKKPCNSRYIETESSDSSNDDKPSCSTGRRHLHTPNGMHKKPDNNFSHNRHSYGQSSDWSCDKDSSDDQETNSEIERYKKSKSESRKCRKDSKYHTKNYCKKDLQMPIETSGSSSESEQCDPPFRQEKRDKSDVKYEERKRKKREKKKRHKSKTKKIV